MSNLPPEQMTARHLNPDFVPRSRYEALAAERDLYHATSLALGVERDALVAKNQQHEQAENDLAVSIMAALDRLENVDGNLLLTIHDAQVILRAALAGTPSEGGENGPTGATRGGTPPLAGTPSEDTE